uniref:Uncharacterized protein n=1 Tax=Arundo donax TaxID=35708 RepID=A0A0A9D4A6_ARUDO
MAQNKSKTIKHDLNTAYYYYFLKCMITCICISIGN